MMFVDATTIYLLAANSWNYCLSDHFQLSFFLYSANLSRRGYAPEGHSLLKLLECLCRCTALSCSRYVQHSQMVETCGCLRHHVVVMQCELSWLGGSHNGSNAVRSNNLSPPCLQTKAVQPWLRPGKLLAASLLAKKP